MSSNTLLDRCSVNTNFDEDTFVGISKEEQSDKYSVKFPLGFHMGETEKEIRKDILMLFNILSKTTDKKESSIEDGCLNEIDNIPIYSYLFLIKDYYEHGYYKEKETIYHCSKRGKINWGRTIKEIKPVIQDNEAYYLKFVTRKNTVNENELITLIHKYCVYLSFEQIGWLFTTYLPIKPKTGLSKKKMLVIVKGKLQNTYNDKNKNLFKNMINILNNIGDDSKSNFIYGTNRFEYCWEKMLDKVYGVSNKKDYFPKTTWNLEGDKKYTNASLEPDTIMLYNNKVYVLDAKYYKFGNTGNPLHLPESTSINKQITYGEYIAENKKFYRNDKEPKVYNAFIMPFDSKSKIFDNNTNIYCAGIANSSWKNGSKSYENVLGLMIDVKYLMTLYSKHDMDSIKELVSVIESNVE